MKNNTINNRNRDDNGRYQKWDVCEFDGCNNILGDLDDGAWSFGHHGEFYCLNHSIDVYESEHAKSGMLDPTKPIEYAKAK
jgi:hypothetical protein